MDFTLPPYRDPAVSAPELRGAVFPPFLAAPVARFEPAPAAGVAPDGYHATSIFPEYVQLSPGTWVLPPHSRMDCVLVREGLGVAVREFRNLRRGDAVAVGRGENGEDGIFVHAHGFEAPGGGAEKFSFRRHVSRETAFSVDYDELYALLRHERVHGRIVWVLGPAAVFDFDARRALIGLIRRGYVHAVLAGNALAVHDLEGSMFGTALGQDIYSRRDRPLGHYNHLDVINAVRGLGSIEGAIAAGLVTDGVMHALHAKGVPYVLAGSIRDDGPLPETIAGAYEAQARMRAVTAEATTVIALATQLHAIATGNLTPSYAVCNGRVRPVYFYCVDMSDFVTTKLANRGSLGARGVLTNVQDFLVTVDRGLGRGGLEE
jgi:lysine-ketoglutarate reductase/saccharopine dehydrogenase-like protein (TIGR00300 family)